VSGVALSAGLGAPAALAAGVQQAVAGSASVPIRFASVYARYQGGLFQWSARLIGVAAHETNIKVQNETVVEQWGQYTASDASITRLRLSASGVQGSFDLVLAPEEGASDEKGLPNWFWYAPVPFAADAVFPQLPFVGPFPVPTEDSDVYCSAPLEVRMDQRRMSLPRRVMVRLAGGR